MPLELLGGTMNEMTILVVEDHKPLQAMIQGLLENNGYAVRTAANGEEALAAIETTQPDLILSDIMMPRMDGFTLAKEIRAKDKVIPLIFITAKSLKEDKLKGYGLGADDYITKPFDEEELLWKIKAVIRRAPGKNIEIDAGIMTAGKYTFDFSTQSLVIDGKMKRITEKECEVLRYLSARRNRNIKREEMLIDLWGQNDYFLGRSLDVFITKIRKYLKDDPDLSIENVFGVGFIFNVP